MKNLTAFALLIAGLAFGVPPGMAQNSAQPSEHTHKKMSAKKTSAKKGAHATQQEEKETEVAGLQPTSFHCELGNKVTIYRDAEDDQRLTLNWNKHMYHLTRVSTTTGANRFEDTQAGLVWIAIPAKSMLLDSKKGHQLANECQATGQTTQGMADKTN